MHFFLNQSLLKKPGIFKPAPEPHAGVFIYGPVIFIGPHTIEQVAKKPQALTVCAMKRAVRIRFSHCRPGSSGLRMGWRFLRYDYRGIIAIILRFIIMPEEIGHQAKIANNGHLVKQTWCNAYPLHHKPRRKGALPLP